jgi:flagellum-specific ATP synthase
VLRSISRLRSDVTPKDALGAGRELIRILATYRRVEDMVNIGAYARGANPDIDRAIDMIGPINDFLRQDVAASATLDESFAAVMALVGAK